jgi:hypothetical protein
MPNSLSVAALRTIQDGRSSADAMLRGPSAAPSTRGLNFGRGPVVMLFYDGFESGARSGALARWYCDFRSVARYAYRSAKGAQVYTGYYVAFQLLVRSLRACGCDVRVNDFKLATANPDYPIGIAGYPSALTHIRLPNPRLLGHGDFGAPDDVAALAGDPRVRAFLQPAQWVAALYPKAYRDKTVIWPVGIDTQALPDLSGDPKDTDVLIYDKIRWHRDSEVPRLLEPIAGHLQASGKSFQVLRYGHHHHRQFAKAMSRSRSLLFLCEHETQGLACQEAMASNLPVLAWDEGILVDPHQRIFAPPGLIVSSVPYFDHRCGERFKSADFKKTFDMFWNRRTRYRPRDFIRETLSMQRSGEAYLKAYFDPV